MDSAIPFRIETTEFGKFTITDGADEKIIEADASTVGDREKIIAAVVVMMGAGDNIKGWVADALSAFAEGATSWGPSVAELRAEAEALAWEAQHPGQLAYKSFPVHALPRVLMELVVEGAAALGCDGAQIALPMLAACSAAVGNSRCIVLKSSWIEPAAIWAVPVLPSGALKSPALDLALELLRKVQAKAFAEWREGMQSYKEQHTAWRNKNKNLRDEEPVPPSCARIIVSDTTVEALAEQLQATPRGLLCERDELSGWLNGFNQYKARGGSDVGHWLTMHSARNLQIDRKTGEQKIVHAPRAFIAITGTIQPGVLRRALTPEYREAGLAARLLLALPPVKRRQWDDATVRQSVKRHYAVTLAGLMELPMVGEPPEPINLPLSRDAKKLWVTFYNQHNAADAAAEGGDLAAAWSKLEGYGARLALVIHCVRVVSGEADGGAVDEVSMAAGIALVRWFAREAHRVYAMLGSGDDNASDGADLVTLIRSSGGRITVRDLCRASRRYRQGGAARDALCRLVEAGKGRWLEIPPSPTGGRPVTLFELATEPLTLRPGDRGDGAETPAHAITNGGNGTVTTVTRGNKRGCVTSDRGGVL